MGDGGGGSTATAAVDDDDEDAAAAALTASLASGNGGGGGGGGLSTRRRSFLVLPTAALFAVTLALTIANWSKYDDARNDASWRLDSCLVKNATVARSPVVATSFRPEFLVHPGRSSSASSSTTTITSLPTLAFFTDSDAYLYDEPAATAISVAYTPGRVYMCWRKVDSPRRLSMTSVVTEVPRERLYLMWANGLLALVSGCGLVFLSTTVPRGTAAAEEAAAAVAAAAAAAAADRVRPPGAARKTRKGLSSAQVRHVCTAYATVAGGGGVGGASVAAATEGWTCCICLEDEEEGAPDGGAAATAAAPPPVAVTGSIPGVPPLVPHLAAAGDDGAPPPATDIPAGPTATTGPAVRVALPCSHTFHRSCIRRWLKRGSSLCPLCNWDVASLFDADTGAPRAAADATAPMVVVDPGGDDATAADAAAPALAAGGAAASGALPPLSPLSATTESGSAAWTPSTVPTPMTGGHPLDALCGTWPTGPTTGDDGGEELDAPGRAGGMPRPPPRAAAAAAAPVSPGRGALSPAAEPRAGAPPADTGGSSRSAVSVGGGTDDRDFGDGGDGDGDGGGGGGGSQVDGDGEVCGNGGGGGGGDGGGRGAGF